MSLIPGLPRSDARSLSAIGLDGKTPEIRRTADGHVDFDHYLLQARALRAQSYGGLFRAIARGLGAILASIRAARARKQALAELLSLDDRGLRDLGLNRAGVYFAVDHGREDVPAAANANERPSRSVA